MNVNQIKRVLFAPKESYLLFRNKFDNLYLWKKYSMLCKNSGFKESFFTLSFDCDTEEDVDVALETHKRLVDMNIYPTYAVPGDLLNKGEKIYKKIFETGAEFINHGGREHVYFCGRSKTYKSCFFYDKQSTIVIKNDILKGHKIFKEIFGIAPKGFRTPHFGTFQSKSQLKVLHDLLVNLNYLYSTSTCPMNGFFNGPVSKVNAIYEIPMTGCFSYPLNVFDSWGFFKSPIRTKSPIDFLSEGTLLSRFANKNILYINIYADPSHIYNREEFFDGINKFLLCNIKHINYKDMLNMVKI